MKEKVALEKDENFKAFKQVIEEKMIKMEKDNAAHFKELADNNDGQQALNKKHEEAVEQLAKDHLDLERRTKDRFEQMEKRVVEATALFEKAVSNCATKAELSIEMDRQAEKLKKTLTDISEQLPHPYLITTKKKLFQDVVLLHFRCMCRACHVKANTPCECHANCDGRGKFVPHEGHNTPWLTAGKGAAHHHHVVEASDYNKWVKVGLSLLKVGRAAVNAVTRFDVEGFVEETTALTKSIDNCCNLVGRAKGCFFGRVKKGVTQAQESVESFKEATADSREDLQAVQESAEEFEQVLLAKEQPKLPYGDKKAREDMFNEIKGKTSVADEEGISKTLLFHEKFQFDAVLGEFVDARIDMHLGEEEREKERDRRTEKDKEDACKRQAEAEKNELDWRENEERKRVAAIEDAKQELLAAHAEKERLVKQLSSAQLRLIVEKERNAKLQADTQADDASQEPLRKEQEEQEEQEEEEAAAAAASAPQDGGGKELEEVQAAEAELDRIRHATANDEKHKEKLLDAANAAKELGTELPAAIAVARDEVEKELAERKKQEAACLAKAKQALGDEKWRRREEAKKVEQAKAEEQEALRMAEEAQQAADRACSLHETLAAEQARMAREEEEEMEEEAREAEEAKAESARKRENWKTLIKDEEKRMEEEKRQEEEEEEKERKEMAKLEQKHKREQEEGKAREEACKTIIAAWKKKLEEARDQEAKDEATAAIKAEKGRLKEARAAYLKVLKEIPAREELQRKKAEAAKRSRKAKLQKAKEEAVKKLQEAEKKAEGSQAEDGRRVAEQRRRKEAKQKMDEDVRKAEEEKKAELAKVEKCAGASIAKTEERAKMVKQWATMVIEATFKPECSGVWSSNVHDSGTCQNASCRQVVGKNDYYATPVGAQLELCPNGGLQVSVRARRETHTPANTQSSAHCSVHARTQAHTHYAYCSGHIDIERSSAQMVDTGPVGIASWATTR
jgi:hypothetical protein